MVEVYVLDEVGDFWIVVCLDRVLSIEGAFGFNLVVGYYKR